MDSKLELPRKQKSIALLAGVLGGTSKEKMREKRRVDQVRRHDIGLVTL